MSGETSKAINHRTRRWVIFLSGLVIAVAGAWLAYVTTVAHQNGPKTVAFIGGGPDAVATFDGTTIQANTAIYTDDPQGAARAREYCGINVPGRATLPWNILQLSIGGGPANVCLRQGQSQTFGDVAIRVEQVGQVQAKLYSGPAIALSRVELSVSTTLAQEIEDFGAPLLLGFGMALCGATLPGGTPREPGAPGSPGRPATGQATAHAKTHTKGRIFRVVSAGIALLVAGGVAASLVLAGCTGAAPPSPAPSTGTRIPASPVASPPPGGPAQVQITVPGRQTPPATVAQAILVRGTVQNLPAGQKIWVLTQNPGGSALNPQPQAAVINSAGSWTSQTFVGSGGDAGKQFQILAVTADTAAVNTITGYLDRARQTGNYPGLPTIPAGARQYDKVPVTRQGGPVASPPPGGPAQVQITVPGRQTPPATVAQAILAWARGRLR
jgi:hypothetical protein